MALGNVEGYLPPPPPPPPLFGPAEARGPPQSAMCAVRHARARQPSTLFPPFHLAATSRGAGAEEGACEGGGTGCGGAAASERRSAVGTLDRAIPPSVAASTVGETPTTRRTPPPPPPSDTFPEAEPSLGAGIMHPLAARTFAAIQGGGRVGEGGEGAAGCTGGNSRQTFFSILSAPLSLFFPRPERREEKRREEKREDGDGGVGFGFGFWRDIHVAGDIVLSQQYAFKELLV